MYDFHFKSKNKNIDYYETCLQATGPQMSVLLQYNNDDNFTIAELHRNTQMDMVS